MAIRVLIERRMDPENQPALSSLLMKLRSKAMHAKGYISGETLRSLEDPKICERERNCPTRDIWLRMSERLMEELSSLTLSDVLDGKKLPA